MMGVFSLGPSKRPAVEGEEVDFTITAGLVLLMNNCLVVLALGELLTKDLPLRFFLSFAWCTNISRSRELSLPQTQLSGKYHHHILL